MKKTREFWIPKEYDEKIIACDGGVEIYTRTFENYNGLGYVAVGWKGKAVKPTFNIIFSTVKNMKAYIECFIANYEAHLLKKAEAKAAAKAKKAAAAEAVNVGDIYYCSWGYDQTNVDFYKVIAKRGHKVTLIEVGSRVVDDHTTYENVVAVPLAHIGEPFDKMVNEYGSFRISSYSSALKWDGKPKHRTAWGYGH